MVITVTNQNKTRYYHIIIVYSKINSNKLGKTDIKNRLFYYFGDINIKWLLSLTGNIKSLNLDNFSSNVKSYENILIYDVAYKTP